MGIEVHVYAKKVGAGGDITNARVYLSTEFGTSDNRFDDHVWTSDGEELVFGSPSDLWGETWTVESIESSQFSVHFNAYNTDEEDEALAAVDYIEVCVYYRCPV